MSDASLKSVITEAVKAAMRAQQKERLGALRLIQADVKRVEVDERIEVDDARLLLILDKMLKQRRDSITQYEAAGRADLADVEKFEASLLTAYMPAGLSAEEISAAITAAISESSAAGPGDMGKAMALLKPKLAGRADMSEVSKLLKAALAQ